LAVTLTITGGTNLGSTAKVLARALGLVLAISILNFFTARSESLWMILMGFRGVVMLVALITLFSLEFFEAVILSIINTVMGWVLAFGLAAALVGLVSIGQRASHEDGWDNGHTQHAMPTDKDADTDTDK